MLERHRAMAIRSQYHFSIAICQIDQFDNIVLENSLSRGNEVLQLFSRIAAAAYEKLTLSLDSKEISLNCSWRKRRRKMHWRWWTGSVNLWVRSRCEKPRI
ncbi:MAG: hypothetical protein CMQ05_16510 [Gammaproteobacteria bacterium]|nr:hypothetical protein [Gammaproteobacteria bacterium]